MEMSKIMEKWNEKLNINYEKETIDTYFYHSNDTGFYC